MSGLSQTVELLNLLGDSTRVRLLSVLSGHELSVAELVRITDLPQSRVSTHLRKLRAEGLVSDRRSGSSTYYTLHDEMGVAASDVWGLLRGHLDDAVLDADTKRRAAVMRARDTEDAWADKVAGEMERHYSPGRTWEATARGFIGLMRLGDVLDIGSGDGVAAELLARRANTFTCVDRSQKVIEAARRRLERLDDVSLHVADMQGLPFEPASFDQVLMFNVLTYADDPAAALAEATRVLRPGGDLALVTLDGHEHGEIAEAYDHSIPGFGPDQLRALLTHAGLEVTLCEVTSRERKKPYFRVVSAFARKPTH
jgi:ArsR family transcriptional regulator